MTALSVARQAGIIQPGFEVYLLGLDENGQITSTTQQASVSPNSTQKSVLNSSRHSSEETCLLLQDEDEINEETTTNNKNKVPYVFVLSGKIWSVLWEEGGPLLDRIVAKGAVYARMSPENKAQLVEKLQGIGYVVHMLEKDENIYNCHSIFY